jgi:hypothetical protein
VRSDAPIALPSRDLEAEAYIAEYKAAKERFYTGGTGGSSWEILVVTAIAPVSVASIQIIQLALPRPAPRWNFLLNFALVTFPLYCAFVLPERAGHMVMALIAATAGAAAAGG